MAVIFKNGPALRALAGTNIGVGSLITPGGDQGPAGTPGPPGPHMVSVDLGNRSRIGSDGYIFTPNYPIADTNNQGILNVLSGNATDFVGGDNKCHSQQTSGANFFVQRAADTVYQALGSQFQILTGLGLGASSYASAAFLVSVPAGHSGARAGMGFNDSTQGVAAYLYFDADWKFHHIDSSGSVYTFFQDYSNNNQASGTTLTINGGGVLSVAGQENVTGTFYLTGGGLGYIQNGCQLIAQSGAYIVSQAGSTLWVEGTCNVTSGANLYVQSSGQIVVQTGGAIITQGGASAIQIANAQPAITIQCETGLGSNSYSIACMRITASATGGRPGIGFWHSGLGYACFLYYESNGKFRFIDAGGVVHEITSS